MMKNNRIFILALLCLSVFCQSNSCPSFNAGDRLQSGKNSLIRSNSASYEYSFDAPISFSVPSSGFEFAVSKSSIYSATATIGDYNSNSGFNYQISAQRKGTSNFLQFSLIASSSGWSSIQVSWFASAREDFAVGNVQYPVAQWAKGSADSYTLTQQISKYLPSANYKVAAFISGFSTSAKQFQISINQKNYDQNSRKLTVVFYSNAVPQPAAITISYIIYPEVHSVFELSYEVRPLGDTGAYQISGPVSFGSVIQYNEFRIANRFLACSGNECPNTCILREDCLALSGGNAYEGQCVFCGVGIIFEYGTCTRRCRANQVYLNRVCICNTGFVRKGNECVSQNTGPTCSQNQIVYNNQCRTCPANSYVSQNTCVCQNGQQYDLTYNSCPNPVPTCSFGEYYNGAQCVCNAGFGRYNGQCRQCPYQSSNDQCICQSGQVYDAQNNRCSSNCGSNSVWNGNSCVCNSGFVLYNNACRQCPSGSSANQNTNTCVCQNNYVFDVVNNRCNVNCPSGYTFNGNSCVCPSGSIQVSNTCRQCPSGSSANQNTNTCVCQNNYVFDVVNNRCNVNCPSGYTFNGNSCVCPSGSIQVSNTCRQCPSGSSANSASNTCVCQNGYSYDLANNRCNFNCGSNEVLSGNTCVCARNFYRYNNLCRQCPSGSSIDNSQTTCICSVFGQTFDIVNNRCNAVQCPVNQVYSNGRCVCATNFVLYNNVCRQCPTSSRADQNSNTCVCLDGFTFNAVSNTCVSRCQNSQTWINGQCACISGYSWYNNGCRQCPKSSEPSSNQQSCVCTSSKALYFAETNLCIECGANSQPNAARTACVCLSGFYQSGNSCLPIQQCNVNEDLVNNQCQCKYGFIRVGPLCVEACGVNEYFTDSGCLCKEGHSRLSGVCRPCPSGTLANPAKTACLCVDVKQYFVAARNLCENCPVNSYPNSDDTDCVCSAGYTRNNNQCISNCPADSTPDTNGNCVCSGGRVLYGNQCMTPVVCPDRSTFNSSTSTCVCNARNENIINGACRTCGENSVWSKDQCVCSTGFFSIAGVCRTCDPRTSYNGTDCLCRLGYFGTRDLCTSCHKSCSQCSGPEANQCLACSDVSLVLQNGFCSKNSPCDYGFFLDNGQCTKCPDNCIECENNFECKTCALGYKTLTQTFSGQKVVSCDEICGDGIKYEQQCDDGNTANGDGCSSTCQEEQGWFCSGGSSNAPSVCKKYIPDIVQLSSKGAVNLGGSVVMSVRASYLPSCISQNECSRCFKAITANVVNANVPILVTINYVPFSQFQFYVKFDFQGLYVSSIFKVVIRLNEEFKGCISEEDYNEQLEVTIDPAFLAKSDLVEELTLDDTIVIPSDLKNYLG